LATEHGERMELLGEEMQRHGTNIGNVSSDMIMIHSEVLSRDTQINAIANYLGRTIGLIEELVGHFGGDQQQIDRHGLALVDENEAMLRTSTEVHAALDGSKNPTAAEAIDLTAEASNQMPEIFKHTTGAKTKLDEAITSLRGIGLTLVDLKALTYGVKNETLVAGAQVSLAQSTTYTASESAHAAGDKLIEYGGMQ
jgi:hypothetical protein